MNSENIFNILCGVEESPDTRSPCQLLEETEDNSPHATYWVHSYLEDCRSIKEFINFENISEGAYGRVHKATDNKSGQIVALKQLLSNHGRLSMDAQRELEMLVKLKHPNIVAGREIVVGSSSKQIYIVMDYIKYDLKGYIDQMRQKSQFLSTSHTKCLMIQLLRAVKHLHSNWVIHRDLKPGNILLTHDGVLKVADFGMAREYHDPLWPYTPVVVTLCYRAPELLLLSEEYSTPIDMWSVGCIFGELVSLQLLFPADSEMEQLKVIFQGLGTPSDAEWPGFSSLPLTKSVIFDEYSPGGLHQKMESLLPESGLDLLHGLLKYDPGRRVTAAAAIHHPYFAEDPVASEPVAIEPTTSPPASEDDYEEYDEESTDSESDDFRF